MAGALFSLLNGLEQGWAFAAVVAGTIWLGGETTCALDYLVTERVLRPVTALALAARQPDDAVAPGVRARLVTAWALGTGAPLVGVLVVGVVGADAVRRRHRVRRRGRALPRRGRVRRRPARHRAGGAGDRRPGHVGARGARADRARRARDARGRRRRQRGRPAPGRLQPDGRGAVRARADPRPVRAPGRRGRGAGGARATAPPSAARSARSARCSSTSSARPRWRWRSRRPRSCASSTASSRSWSTWPSARAGSSTSSRATPRCACSGRPSGATIRRATRCAARARWPSAWRASVPEVDFGIGVSAGTAVAGNVGAEHRFEYTVIGDPVNEAARLCDAGQAAAGARARLARGAGAGVGGGERRLERRASRPCSTAATRRPCSRRRG